jgi:aryl-alcohol dehydrogenase-like predicted oxidoreductase
VPHLFTVYLRRNPSIADTAAQRVTGLRRAFLQVQAHGAVGRGFLTGQVTTATEFGEGDIRATLPRFEREGIAANLALVEGITNVARARRPPSARSPWHGCSPRSPGSCQSPAPDA